MLRFKPSHPGRGGKANSAGEGMATPVRRSGAYGAFELELALAWRGLGRRQRGGGGGHADHGFHAVEPPAGAFAALVALGGAGGARRLHSEFQLIDECRFHNIGDILAGGEGHPRGLGGKNLRFFSWADLGWPNRGFRVF